MTCKGVLGSMTDYLEGDAGKKVCMEIEEHLEGCEKCRMHVDTMRAIVTLYKGWRSDPIPDEVSMRLKKALAETARRAAGSRPRGRYSRPACGAEPAKRKKRKSVKVRNATGSDPAKRGKRSRKRRPSS